MYINKSVIIQALKELESVHPFFGITYLVAKQGDLSVGRAEYFNFNDKEKEFLDTYYKPNKQTVHYFRVFRV